MRRRPVWLVRPLGLKAVQKEAEVTELETKRFCEAAARRSADAGMRQLLGGPLVFGVGLLIGSS